MAIPQRWHYHGTIEITAPGRYDIFHRNGVGIGYRPSAPGPALAPATADEQGLAHHCDRCPCCGTCACASTADTCRRCADFAEWTEQARPKLQAYLDAASQPDAFTQTHGRTHRVGCSTLASTINTISELLTITCPHDTEGRPVDLPRVPEVVGPTVLRRRRCAICCPDVTVPEPRRAARGAKGRYVANGQQ